MFQIFFACHFFICLASHIHRQTYTHALTHWWDTCMTEFTYWWWCVDLNSTTYILDICAFLSLSLPFTMYSIFCYIFWGYTFAVRKNDSTRVKFQYEEGINDTSGNHIHWKWEHILVNERMNESANWIYIERFDFFYDLYQKKKETREKNTRKYHAKAF